MKKSRRTILFLESLENRVVPSNTQALLSADHGAAELSVVEIATPPVENDAHSAEAPDGASGAARGATIWDLASSEQARQNGHGQAGNSDSSDSGSENSDHGLPVDRITAESTESLSNGGSSDKKTGHDSENSKAKESEDDQANSNPVNSTGSSIVDSDSTNGSNAHSNNGSAKDKDDLKSNSSSNNARTESSLSDDGSARDVGGVSTSGSNNGSTKNNDDVKSSSSDDSRTVSKNSDSTSDATDSGNVVSKNVDSTGTNSVAEKTNHGKFNSDHNGNSTSSVTSGDGIQSVSAGDTLASQPRMADARSNGGSAESNPTVNESSSALAPGFAQVNEGGASAFSSVAAIITAQEAGLNLPRLADAAIPLAVPALEAFTPRLGLGELGDGSTLAAVESLTPVAGDLIVGFLPVEQVALGPAMQEVLNQIDALGEQLVGSSAARWLYPFIFTALAATTVYHLAFRRRRQFRGQSVWVRDGATWSSTWFPFLSSSIQQ
jgi:hypothetical protein